MNNAGSVDRDKQVAVTTAWRVLRLRMEDQPPAWRVAANITRSSRDSRQGVVLQLGVDLRVDKSSPKNWICYQTRTLASGLD
jgi:hypothetical protein